MHIDGLKRLTENIKSYNSLAVAQLHHAGMRSPEDIIGEVLFAPPPMMRLTQEPLI